MFNTWKSRKLVRWLEQERNSKKRYNKAENFFRFWMGRNIKKGKLHSLTKLELQHYLKHYKLSCNRRMIGCRGSQVICWPSQCGNIHCNTNCKIWQNCDWWLSWWWLKLRQWRRGCLQFGRWGPSCSTAEWRGGGIYYNTRNSHYAVR